MTSLLTLLVLLQIKHFVCDWVIQTEKEVRYKGVYLNPTGMLHSLKHAWATWVIAEVFFSTELATLAFLIDGITHYHIDWLKQTISKKLNLTPSDGGFWVAMGLDQMAHQLVYLAIAYTLYKLL
jgi:hypothetical protein